MGSENEFHVTCESRIVVHATDGSVVVEYPAPTGRIDPPWAWRPA